MFRSSRLRLSAVVLISGLLLAGVAGCTTDELVDDPTRESVASPAPADAPAPAPTIPLAGRSEANLVNEMVLHRTMYAQYLQAMATFYSENGYEQKANWARAELRDVRKIKAADYITDAEVPVAPEERSLSPISLADRHEPDLVEDMVLHRNMYGNYLRALVTFYSENGFDEKANLARIELKGLQDVAPYNYIMDAELPLESLRPTESIVEADKLYEDGLKLMDKGGHRVIIWYHEGTMKKALARFKELIAKYPTSDKIDDAAYYIAEIHKEYNQERDNQLAIEWYKRAIAWNPNLPHPAWSHAAHILDFRMHEREKALEWYYLVLEKEKDQTDARFAMNVKVAHKRIGELTAEESRYAPAEPTPEVQPAPRPAGGQ
jgi:tetratricopeptide (TPR) repeat protein